LTRQLLFPASAHALFLVVLLQSLQRSTVWNSSSGYSQ